MNSSDVSRAIRADVWPMLRHIGFSAFTSHNAWRHAEKCTHVVNFQSFSTHLAACLKCPAHSFGINLGCYLHFIPPSDGRYVRLGKQMLPQPNCFECHFQRGLLKRIAQPDYPRADIWYVAPDGLNLSDAIRDANAVLGSEALPWFERFSSLREVFRTLVEEEACPDGTWGFGRKGSLNRNYITAFVAIELGMPDVAVNSLRATIDSGCFKRTDSDLWTLLDKLSRT